MSGFPGWTLPYYLLGWFETNTEGIPSIYLSIEDSGFVTIAADTPANKSFVARIIEPQNFSFTRRPVVWPHGDTSVQLASFAELSIDNVDGLYAFLVGADLRDSPVQVRLLNAPPNGLAAAFAHENAPIIATAVLDNVTSSEDVITITLKDILSTFDRALPVKYNPPFVDAGAANRMVPISLGACRNVAPQLIDAANRIYRISDGPISNLAAVRDGGAPLDANATPPGYESALDTSGVQLETQPIDKLTIDCSSEGRQDVIPGIVDVLDGIGTFLGDSTGGSIPDGWNWSNGAGTLIQRLTHPPYPYDGMISLLTDTVWYPTNAKYGTQLSTQSTVLKGGKAYRLNAHLFSVVADSPPLDGVAGGIQFRSALSGLEADSISPNGLPLSTPAYGNTSYTFEFRCPAGPDRKLYIIVSAPGTPVIPISSATAILYGVTLEELGEFIELPLKGMTLARFGFEWFVDRGGVDESKIEFADLVAIDNATGYKYGFHVTDQPNMLDGFRTVLDSACATVFSDHTGLIRVRRLSDPRDGIPLCTFDPSNIKRPIGVDADPATALTTLIGAARNWDPLGDSDFVTDHDTVTDDIRARFKQTSQYQRTSALRPAGEYSFAVGAAVFDSLIDDPNDAQREIDRVVGIWAPRVYADGTISTGKRRIITFTASFDDITKIGSSLRCDVRDLIYNAVFTFHYPKQGFINTPCAVIGWEIFPIAKQIIITGFC